MSRIVYAGITLISRWHDSTDLEVLMHLVDAVVDSAPSSLPSLKQIVCDSSLKVVSYDVFLDTDLTIREAWLLMIGMCTIIDLTRPGTFVLQAVDAQGSEKFDSVSVGRHPV